MTFDLTHQDHLLTSEGFMPLWGVWINARNRTTGADEPFAIWQGADNQTFAIPAGSTNFYGAQGSFQVSQLNRTVGVKVQSMSVSLNGASPESVQVIRGYDVRFCRADVFLFLTDPSTGNSVSTPVRMFKGYVNGAPQVTDATGGNINYTLELVSHFRDLTQSPNLYKSHQEQSSLDDLRQYATVTGVADDPWGGE